VKAVHQFYLKNQEINFHVNFVGSGELEKELKSFVHTNNINDYFTFHGVQQDVNSILLNSHIFLLPSIDEGFPIAILEAMRTGLPIVSTNVGGIAEMIDHGKSGFLIESTVEGIYEMLFDIKKHNWLELGEQSRNIFLNKFTISKMLQKYCEVFEN
jgi:glycosyltransferase involved in cell wall biosynthesis